MQFFLLLNHHHRHWSSLGRFFLKYFYELHLFPLLLRLPILSSFSALNWVCIRLTCDPNCVYQFFYLQNFTWDLSHVHKNKNLDREFLWRRKDEEIERKEQQMHKMQVADALTENEKYFSVSSTHIASIEKASTAAIIGENYIKGK